MAPRTAAGPRTAGSGEAGRGAADGGAGRPGLIDPALAAALVVGVALRARAFLSGRSLWLDEVLLALNLRDRELTSLLLEPMERLQSAPPGYLMLARGAIRLFGPSDHAARSVAFIAGVALVVLGVVHARRAFRSGLARVGFAWAIALSPTLIYYSHEVKQYSSDALATVVVLLMWQHRHRWSARRLGLLGAGVALISLPGLISLSVLAAAILAEGRSAGSLTVRRDLARVLPVWGLAASLHVVHGLTVGGDRDYMRAWWSMKSGFPPLLPWGRDDLSWFATTGSRTVWLALGHEGRAFPSMDRGPILVAVLVVLLVVIALARGGSRTLSLLGVPLGIFAATVGASFVRLYPFSSRLLVFLVPAVLAVIFGAVDLLVARWRGGDPMDRVRRSLLVAAVVGLLGTAAVPSAGWALRPQDDRDAREAIRALAEWPVDAVVVGFQPVLLDWYGDSPRELEVLGRAVPPDGLASVLLDVESGRSTSVWVISTQSSEEAAIAVDSLGAERFACVFHDDGTFVAIAVASAQLIDPGDGPASEWCDPRRHRASR